MVKKKYSAKVVNQSLMKLVVGSLKRQMQLYLW